MARCAGFTTEGLRGMDPRVSGPRRIILWLTLGVTLGSYQTAFAQSSQSNSQQLARTLEQAQSHLAKKEFAAAARKFQEGAKLQPIPELYEKEGLSWFMGKSYPEAQEAFQESVRRGPNRWSSRLFLGMSLYKINRFQEALPHIERAFELNPQQNDIRYWLGLTHQALGNYEQAVKELQAALDKDPENIDILYALTQAYLDISAVLLKRLGPDNPDQERREALRTELNQKLGSSPSPESWDQSVRRIQELKERYARVRNPPPVRSRNPIHPESNLYQPSPTDGGTSMGS